MVAQEPSSPRFILIATILGSSIVFIDATVVNVALPSIQRDLGGGLAAQQWIVDAYLLTLGSLILVGGSLGDIFGAVRVFRIGLTGFGVASALCAVAPTANVLIVCRGLQGIAGALLTPASLAVITNTFTGPERGAAIGTWTAWSGVVVLGGLAGGTLCLVAFVLWELRQPQPMLPLGLFRRRNFSVTNVETFAVYGGLSAWGFFLAVYLQQIAGYSPFGTGLAMLPVTLAL